MINHLLEAGAIAVGPDGRIRINLVAADIDVARAAREFISLMAKGDEPAVRSLLQHYVVVNSPIRDLMAKLGPPPPLQRQVYVTANRLSPPVP